MALVYDMETDIRFKQGIERGREKERLSVIKNMLSQNTDIKIIAQATELSIYEIMKIKFDEDKNEICRP